MKMRAGLLVLIGMIALAVFFAFNCDSTGAGSSGDDDTNQNDDDVGDDDDQDIPSDDPYIVDSSNTDCKEFPKDGEPEEGIELSYEGGILTVVHTNVLYNCCIDRVDVEMEVDDFVIDLYETEVVPMPCDCICYFDVTTRIAELGPGTYTVNVYVYGRLSVSGEVEIP